MHSPRLAVRKHHRKRRCRRCFSSFLHRLARSPTLEHHSAHDVPGRPLRHPSEPRRGARDHSHGIDHTVPIALFYSPSVWSTPMFSNARPAGRGGRSTTRSNHVSDHSDSSCFRRSCVWRRGRVCSEIATLPHLRTGDFQHRVQLLPAQAAPMVAGAGRSNLRDPFG